jgi:hypothetical protein
MRSFFRKLFRRAEAAAEKILEIYSLRKNFP